METLETGDENCHSIEFSTAVLCEDIIDYVK